MIISDVKLYNGFIPLLNKPLFFGLRDLTMVLFIGTNLNHGKSFVPPWVTSPIMIIFSLANMFFLVKYKPYPDNKENIL